MEKAMVKICPSCRMKNSAELSHCESCNADLSRAAAKVDGVGVSMFGSAPVDLDIKPLKSQREAAISSSYGSVQKSETEEDPKEESEKEAQVFSAAAIKKPWE